MPIKMFATRTADLAAAQTDWNRATAAQQAEMVAYANTEAYEGSNGFEVLAIGVNSVFNLIDFRSGVQVWLGTDYLDGGVKFWIGRPASTLNSGVRAVDSADSLAEALEIADAYVFDATAKMNRAHGVALKLNAKI